jgi:hypothetical protein
MAKHEASCTANPDRYCNMCAFVEGGYNEDSFFDLVNVLHLGIEIDGDMFTETTKNKLAEIVDGCPVCIFAALRQTDNLWRWGETNWKKQFDDRFRDRMEEIHEENMSMVGYVW